jgi:hypothetical protein
MPYRNCCNLSATKKIPGGGVWYFNAKNEFTYGPRVEVALKLWWRLNYSDYGIPLPGI